MLLKREWWPLRLCVFVTEILGSSAAAWYILLVLSSSRVFLSL